MFDAAELLKKNWNRKRKTKYIKPNDAGRIVLNYKNKEFGSVELRDLASDIYYIIRVYKRVVSKIYIVIENFTPKDKLVYILIECIIYTLIVKYNVEAMLVSAHPQMNINTDGLRDSILLKLSDKKDGNGNFIKHFNLHIDKNHFRRVINKEDFSDTSTSRLTAEIKTFLFRFHMDRDFDSNLALMIGELADNVYEHAQTDCLIDIDITDKVYYNKDLEEEKNYYAINVVVLNFSDKCLYHDVQSKIKNKYFKDSVRYNKVHLAYENHSQKYTKRYNEVDFFTVTSFQDCISGRKDETKTGGTGLTQLVKSIMESAQEDYCYVLTGNSGLYFKKEYLKYSDDGWIGFNESGKYIEEIPHKESIIRSNAYLPGTGYNFMLCFGGKEDEKKY